MKDLFVDIVIPGLVCVLLLTAIVLIVILCFGQCSPEYLLASMSSAPKPWKAVTVVYSDDDVEECSMLDAVDARAALGNYSPSATKKAEELAIKRLRIATAKLDGDTVLVLRVESGDGRAHAWGEAYRCGEAR